MELPELKKSILDNQVSNFLVFIGSEYALKDIYIKEISNRLNLSIQYIEDIASNRKNISLVEEHYLYVLENNTDIISNPEIVNNVGKDNYLIYLADKIDKRSKLYKEYSDKIVEFNYLDENTLLSIISTKYNLSDNNIKWLINACKNDYGKCLQELDKLAIFRENREENQDELFKYIKDNGGFHEELPDVVFKFVDAVAVRNKKLAWELYEILENIKESKIEILSLLYNRIRNILIVQMINNPTFEATGLTNFQLFQGRQGKGFYSDNELFKNLELLKNIDADIKLGNIDEAISVKYALVNIL